jgi:hypothetical protein
MNCVVCGGNCVTNGSRRTCQSCGRQYLANPPPDPDVDYHACTIRIPTLSLAPRWYPRNADDGNPFLEV